MKMSNTVFFTTIFPASEEYFYDFFDSLRSQTYKKFDVLVVNDGYSKFINFKNKYKDLNIIEILNSQSASKNRQFGIKYAIDSGYENIIFGDSDDLFGNNRVEVCLNKLNEYPVVVNDLSLFNDTGVFSSNYISNRINNNSEIGINNILNKNFFGLSNSAVRSKIVKNIIIDSELIAADWYLFSILLLKKNKAIFTNETTTYYRQHTNNTIGIGQITLDNILLGIRVKLKHYNLLKKNYEMFEVNFNEILTLQKKISDFTYIEKLTNQIIKFPLWWEVIRLID